MEHKEKDQLAHSVNIYAPNVTMKITDINGEEIQEARIGGKLILRFDIVEENSN